MSSLKKIFLTGLLSLFGIWVAIELGKLMYRFVGPIRGLFFKICHVKFFGIEFVVTIAVVLFVGSVITLLSQFKSGIPIISHFFRFTKMVGEIVRKIQTGEIKVVLIEDRFIAFTTGVTDAVDGQRRVSVFRPFIPNILSGLPYFVPEEEFKKLPQLNGRLALRMLVYGWLSRKKEE